MTRKKDKLPEAASSELKAIPTDDLLAAMDYLYNLLAPTLALAQQVETALFTEVVLIIPRRIGNITRFYGYDVILADVDQPYVGVRSRT